MATEQNSSSSLQVFCIGTLDTKLQELRFLSEAVRSTLNSFSNNSSTKVHCLLLPSLIFCFFSQMSCLSQLQLVLFYVCLNIPIISMLQLKINRMNAFSLCTRRSVVLLLCVSVCVYLFIFFFFNFKQNN